MLTSMLVYYFSLDTSMPLERSLSLNSSRTIYPAYICLVICHYS